MVKLKNITIGSDPEFFATDGTKLVPSYKFLPGTKEDPFSLGNGYFVQRDNVLVEGNIPIAYSAEEFEANMISLKNQIHNNFLKSLGLQLLSADSGEYLEEDLQHPEALTLGCSPYDNVWITTKKQNLKKLALSRKRPAGFHIHVGYSFEDPSNEGFREMINLIIAKLFDFLVILPSYKIHLDPFRNKYYGGLGKIRHKEYGVELRSLGGFFTQEKYFIPLYNQIINILKLIEDDEIYYNVFQAGSIDQLENIPQLIEIKEKQTEILINV